MNDITSHQTHDAAALDALKSRLLLEGRSNTIYRVISVFEPEPEFLPMRRLNLIDLVTGQEETTRFVCEIDNEFIVIPTDYPRSKINEYLKAAREYKAADHALLAIFQDILASSLESEDCHA